MPKKKSSYHQIKNTRRLTVNNDLSIEPSFTGQYPRREQLDYILNPQEDQLIASFEKLSTFIYQAKEEFIADEAILLQPSFFERFLR